jgi:hypothetical protein
MVTPKGSMPTERERGTRDGYAEGEHANREREREVPGMVTPKGSMPTERERERERDSVLPYRCSICPPLVTRQIIL